jgi:hypothetical protein
VSIVSYTEALEESTIECNASTEITIREDMDEAVVTTTADEVDTTATIQEDVVEEDIMEDDTGMVVSTGNENTIGEYMSVLSECRNKKDNNLLGSPD